MANRFIVMGVSGCGKSTVGAALAARLGLPFIEGDQLHTPESVAKMSAGVPLEDADRWPWLDRVGAALLGSEDGAVASCSALRLVYRDRLRAAVGPELGFILVDLPREVLEQRMLKRTGHYMPPTLLDSQLRTLERPDGEPNVLVVDGTSTVAEMMAEVDRWRT